MGRAAAQLHRLAVGGESLVELAEPRVGEPEEIPRVDHLRVLLAQRLGQLDGAREVLLRDRLESGAVVAQRVDLRLRIRNGPSSADPLLPPR